MKLHKSLATGFLEAHPEHAARVLESLPEAEVQAVLASTPAPISSAVIRRIAPQRAAAVLTAVERSHARSILERLGLDLAVLLLRRMDAAISEEILSGLGADLAHSLRTMLRFPVGTAGSLMDPTALALPGDLSVHEALSHIREHPASVRYNLYVVDRDQVLIGVLNLRELMTAGRRDPLKAIAQPRVLSIRATADRHAVLTHPVWRNAHALPVVDTGNVYLGAVRYRTLRRLEAELQEGAPEGAALTAEALGDLFAAGIAGVLAALATSVARPLPGSKP